VELSFLAFVYVSGGLALILGLWVFYERRDRRVYQAHRRQSAFHCVRCGHLYADAETRGERSCPHCGFANTRLHF
jgi:rubrerythrin